MITEFLNKILWADEPVACSKCGSTYCVWFPSPKIISVVEMEKVKTYALCEYCMFKVKND